MICKFCKNYGIVNGLFSSWDCLDCPKKSEINDKEELLDAEYLAEILINLDNNEAFQSEEEIIGIFECLGKYLDFSDIQNMI